MNIENGLSQSSVLAIAQDAKGYIWFGTRYGLNKYDSRNFKIYKNEPDNENSLSHSEYLSMISTSKDGSVWIGTRSGLNKYNEAQDNFERITHDPADDKSLSDSKINCIYHDKKDRLWVGTKNGLNLLLSGKGYRFKRFFSSKNLSLQIYAIFEDHNETLWLSTSKGLMTLKFKNGYPYCRYFKVVSNLINKVNDNYISCFAEDRENNIWFGTKQTGLFKLQNGTKKITSYSYNTLHKNGINSNNIRKILVDLQGNIWIGSLHGINIYHYATKTFTTLQNEPNNAESLSQNSVYTIFQDQQGIIWVGTYYGGINMVYPNYTPFHTYTSAKDHTGLSGRVINSLTEDVQGNLWVGTEGEGLNYFDRTRHLFTHYKHNPNNPSSISADLIKAIIKDKKNNIWVGTHLGGLNRLNPNKKTFTRFQNDKNDLSSINGNEITSMYEDSNGRFWVGTSIGLDRFYPETGKFVHNQIEVPKTVIRFIYEDSKHTIWIASNSGLYQLKEGSSKFVARKTDDLKKLSYSSVTCVYEDHLGYIWLGTFKNGLFRLDEDSRCYSKISGLPSNNVTGIIEDDQHHLWISTDNGLCKYNPINKSFNIYNTKDGLVGNEFNYNSILKDSRGEFFFGSLSGLISFFPNAIKENKIINNAQFTDLKLFNKTIDLHASNHLLDSNISVIKSITFTSNQKVFSVDFTVLNFLKANKNLYAYKLVGFEKNWNYVSIPSASYTNLSPGKYTLLVKGSNNDGVWSKHPTELAIKVLPPFYLTWWAYLLYLSIIAAILIIVVRYLLIKAVLTKEKEINEQKLQFFTNISHEIRTPLTLIIAPLEKLIDKTYHSPALHRDLLPIQHNAQRLMTLVTELLDFRKSESGKLKLKVSKGDFVHFCHEIFIAFENSAITQNITYLFESEKQRIDLYFDKLQMEKVLFNLLSNAFKFCRAKGKIALKIIEDENHVFVKISDSGKGIPKEMQANLFQNFYQVDSDVTIGTGLGLSLSKNIVLLHHGHIELESDSETAENPGYTCFTVSLKKGNKHFNINELTDDVTYLDVSEKHNQLETQVKITPATTSSMHAIENKNFTILLVEDNVELRNFIKISLSELYTVYDCENGEQGWETATELIPDLIISDVMMPKMDGLELCRNIKTDVRTNHISVILLTARSTYIHQISGLENGADAYIMKPFNLKILLLNIQNLLQARETIKKKYAEITKLEPKDIFINKHEQDFLTKIIQLIEENMVAPDFGVPALASKLGMSQSVLYKKMRALTDLSVNDFIKSIRLKKAAYLLEQNIGNISEVAYSVGFNDRKYFSIEFKKQFNLSPSEFIKQQKENK
ncbi:hybrid sensor histidine kinase/response regulator transcription factor [Pedobacter sp. MW01-1-1]|uniref:hybrid sensor histidine kinase/response regulator transcription factor n=1 Tax=Pedobacter sp. MW01-1-1 TaxID=3383027 RepID=UPI003FED45F4